MREHNRIAEQLSIVNPTWDGQRLFQEARKIVGAEMQKIAYKEYLPLILGDIYDQLVPEYSGYDINVYPNTINAYDAAAFRFGHSMIRSYLSRLGKDYIPIGPLNIVSAFFAPQQFVEGGGTDPILRGLLTEPVGLVDEFLNHFITNNLFAANITSPGLDLASINIQRGRDHGLPPYFTWKMWALQECGTESAFTHILTKTRLLQLYGSLDTVDLFVGGLAESPLDGGMVGATFACIFAKMFQVIRDGDRFYYENDDPITGIFTESQREEIERTSLSRVICDNSDNIRSIQPDAFRADQNRVDCSLLPSMDLTVWEESIASPDSMLDWDEIEGAPSHIQGGHHYIRDDDKLNAMNDKQMDHEGNPAATDDDTEYASIAELLSEVFEFIDTEDD
jgi:peroxidase